MDKWVERVITFVWRQHYRIPRGLYWLVFVVSAAALPLDHYLTLPWLWLPPALGLFLSATGLIRWAYESTPPPALVVTRFYARDDLRTRAEEVQRLTVKTLDDHLGATLGSGAVRTIPLVIGPEEARFAAAVKRRLHAWYLVYGELRLTDEGTLHIRPRLLTTKSQIYHQDPHTKEFIPHNTGLRLFLRSLTPAPGVGEEEYPFAFAFELEALVRGLSGEIEMMLERYEKAEREYEMALGVVSADSRSAGIDHIRVRLAHSIYWQGREKEALDYLRARAIQEPVSTEFLFELASLLGTHNQANRLESRSSDPDIKAEIESLLRRVVEDRTFRSLDQAQYNLANVLMGGDDHDRRLEGQAILENLVVQSSYYSKVWYVKLALGGCHWFRAKELEAKGDDLGYRAEMLLSAHFYREALRSRPRFDVSRGPFPTRIRRFRKSAILYANALDAHRESDQRLRAWYLSRMTQRVRRRHIRRGGKALARGAFLRAYVNYDWTIIGRNDMVDIFALVGKSISLEKLDKQSASKATFLEAQSIDEEATKSALAHFVRKYFSDEA